MKQIDYEKGNIVTIIVQSSIPIMIAQMINLLYNIVDRIYIARIPGTGTQSLGAVGLCFPVILIILAFTNLFGSGGSPLFAIERGRKNNMEAKAIMDTCFILLIITSLILMIIGWMASREILTLLGASEENLVLGIPYLRIYILGTVFSMVATGMNPFIQAQGYPSIAMISVTVGAILNLILDPLFIFVIGLQIRGAAIATVLSQAVSACIVLYFLFQKTEIKLFPCSFSLHWHRIGHIVGLGTASFVMVMTNSLVQMACNHTLVLYGGDMYISVMTVLSSVRQMIETPIGAITDGSSPVLSYHYGGMHYRKVQKAARVMFTMAMGYAFLIWLAIMLVPTMFLSIFSSDESLHSIAIDPLRLYFSAFIFMVFQYTGQTVFKAMDHKGHAIFFSLLRKVFIVIPLTLLLPSILNSINGVFLAEPISNVVGGMICFITMIRTFQKLKNDSL